MFPTAMFEDASVSSSSGTRVVVQDLSALNNVISTVSLHHQQPQKIKKKRSLPGNPDPDAEVIALSPKTLLATNRYVCEICHKGFQREQNLQLHRRGHNLPWKLKQRSTSNKEVVVKKKAYVCPEPSCVHHNPSRALGDLTGIKKHYCRKHGEKKWRCEKCSKVYAVQSDWKAHSKTCGTREYRCDCGSIFSRKDSFITHRAFCDALAEESERLSATQIAAASAASAAATNPLLLHSLFFFPNNQQHNFQNHHITTTNYFSPWNSSSSHQNPNPSIINNNFPIKPEPQTFHDPSAATTTFSSYSSPLTLLQQLQNHNASRIHVASSNAATSATALLQMAATVGAIGTSTTTTTGPSSSVLGHVTRLSDMGEFGRASQQPDWVMGMRSDNHQQLQSEHHRLTRDFLGLKMVDNANVNGGVVDVSMNVKDMLTFTGGNVEYHQHQAHHIPQQQQRFGFFGINSSTAPDTWGN